MKRGKIRAVSAKRRAQMVIYKKLRAEFLEARPWCEYPEGCGQLATEVQHRRGRRGERLNDVDWWAASCRAHNMQAEEDTGRALAIGWLVRIEGGAA